MPYLGFLYALDTFIPLAKFRIDQDRANALPNDWWLKAWLKVHRLAGAIVCLAIFIFVINAARN